jgi:hypothetical protein
MFVDNTVCLLQARSDTMKLYGQHFPFQACQFVLWDLNYQKAHQNPQEVLIEQAPFPEFTGLFPLKWSFWTSLGIDFSFLALK